MDLNHSSALSFCFYLFIHQLICSLLLYVVQLKPNLNQQIYPKKGEQHIIKLKPSADN